MKPADISAAFKQGLRNKRENYKPVSILLSFQKFLKRLFSSNSQITLIIFYQNFNVVLEKATAPQHCLLLMIDNWKKAIDNQKVIGAVLTDISKIFHCICHDLLIAKLNAHGLPLPILKRTANHLQNRKQRTVIESIYSDLEDTFQELHKVQYLSSCYLVSFFVTYFLKRKIFIL